MQFICFTVENVRKNKIKTFTKIQFKNICLEKALPICFYNFINIFVAILWIHYVYYIDSFTKLLTKDWNRSENNRF